jgi:MYXO-CTERM domain-containing protein
MLTTRLALLLVPFVLVACTTAPEGDGAARPGGARVRDVPDDYPALGFDPHPDYLPNNVLVLTFDDGPDWGGHTAAVLDVLKEKDVKATFFINTINWSDVNTDEPMQALVHRIIDEGHELASHSVHHPHLPTLSAEGVEDEIAGVENTLHTVLGASSPRMSLFRAPFGEPYQDGNGYEMVAPVVAEHAVHIGWNYDTQDWMCPQGDSNCVLSSFKNGVKTPGHGAYGIILMHSVNPQTPEALPAIIDYARDKGFEFWNVEKVVCAKFDRSSSHVVDNTQGGCNALPPPDPDAPDADVPNPPDPDDPDADVPNPPDPEHPDAGPGEQPTTPGTPTGSCGCRVGGANETGGPAVVLLGSLAFLLVRRRRR